MRIGRRSQSTSPVLASSPCSRCSGVETSTRDASAVWKKVLAAVVQRVAPDVVTSASPSPSAAGTNVVRRSFEARIAGVG